MEAIIAGLRVIQPAMVPVATNAAAIKFRFNRLKYLKALR